MVEETVYDLKKKYKDEIINIKIIKEKKGIYATLRPPLQNGLKKRLSDSGIEQLYKHQVKAITELRKGKNVIIVAGTASGKSLCYNIPVIEKLCEDRRSRALYIFPTKALTRDQLKNLRKLAPKDMVTAIYDGDTPVNMRSWVRKSARIILTNPDMLHFGILTNHKKWGDFLMNLDHIVIDDAHIYRGVFGANVAFVLRRMERILKGLGQKPSYTITTATLANPKEFGEKLCGKDFVLVEDDASPTSLKYIIFWNPPLIEGERASSNSETVKIFLELIKRSLRTIVFSKSRKTAELLIQYALSGLPEKKKHLISPYRAGYMPEERRKIEKALFNGKMLGVSSTSALELGIDIGELDAVIINGFPGTISSFWQQAGRTGRTTRTSVVFFVALDDPLDQYYITHPEFFFGRSHEAAVFDLGNQNILSKHLVLASLEKPLKKEDEKHFGKGFDKALDLLLKDEKLKKKDKRYFPKENVGGSKIESIRTTSFENFLIVEKETGNLLGTVDRAMAFLTVHPGAIYLHRAENYRIEEMDAEKKIALAKQMEVDYYTMPKELTDIRIIATKREKKSGNLKCFWGKVEVTQRIIAYQKRKVFTGEVMGVEELELPPQTFQTEALWFTIDERTIKRLGLNQIELAGGIHGIEHAAISLLPIYALCDRWDIGGVSTPFHEQLKECVIFIYDGIEGGIGIAERGFEVCGKHLKTTYELIRNCRCREGCPSCIQSPKCGNWNEPLNKNAAKKILKAIIEKG